MDHVRKENERRFINLASAVFAVLLIAVLFLAGCGKEEATIGNYAEAVGVRLELRDVSPTGATLVFAQSGDTEKEIGELIYGEGYLIEKKSGRKWKSLSTVVEDYGFYDIGYLIPPGGQSELSIDWEWLYGKLKPGTYRILTTVWERPEGGVGEQGEYALCGEFQIE